MSGAYLRSLIAAGDKAALMDALDNPVLSAFADDIDDKGRSLLHAALAADMPDAVPALMAAGARARTADAQGRTALHLAAEKGYADICRLLLDAGLDINARAGGGRFEGPAAGMGDTALHLAIEGGHVDTAALLMARGANPVLKNPDNKDGLNAWHAAAKCDNPAMIDLLLAHPEHARMNDFCAQGRTHADAFRLALREGHGAVVQRFIDHGIDVNRRDSEGHTPLHWLILHRKTRAEALPMLKLLLKNGADGDKAANLWGETPLMVAAKADFPEAMQLLLDKGADVTRLSNFRETALHFAARHYTVETIHILLDHGADINAPDRIGQTALHIAAHHNRRDVVKTLVAHGANPLLKDQRGRTPDLLCQAPVQETTRAIVVQAQDVWRKGGRPVLENGRLRRRFNLQTRSARRAGPPRFDKKPPSNGGGYQP